MRSFQPERSGDGWILEVFGFSQKEWTVPYMKKQEPAFFVKPDIDRTALRVVYYRDGNGMFFSETLDGMNPYWQGDYATVHFSYRPAGGMPLRQDLFLFGELTNYGKDPQAKMIFNKEKGVYETSLWLKQGYYDYGYALKETNNGHDVYVTEKNGRKLLGN